AEQNLPAGAISTPQPEQNFFCVTRGAPHSAQNFPPGCLAPHLPQATWVPPGENVGAGAGACMPAAMLLPTPRPTAICAPRPAMPPPTPCSAMPLPAPMTAWPAAYAW